MKRRLVSLLLVLAMLLPLFPAQALAADGDNPFRDVRQGSWYYDFVQYVRLNSLFNGTSADTFSPADTMTRGMFVTVLGRIAGVDEEAYQGTSSFQDVPAEAYFAPYVAWASKHGITTGTGEDRFSPYAYINRQQMATFFVRYFDAFDVAYDTGANITTAPADIDKVSPYAREAVLKLWQQGLLNGDGDSFDPLGNATRAQTAAICYRVDEAVPVWYREPGVLSDRVRIPLAAAEEEKPSGGSSNYYSVRFYDGNRLIDTLSVRKGQPLGKVPAAEKSAKAGAVLAGYYADKDFTTPFYADDPVIRSMSVYAKYEAVEGPEEVLHLTSFARMDQSPHLTFRIKRVSGDTAPKDAAVLQVMDGSAAVALTITPDSLPEPSPDPEPSTDPESPEQPDDPAPPDQPPEPETLLCTVAADPAFNEGCTYQLTLSEGWIFVDGETGEDKPETIRTASFSIAMAEVHNMRMSEAIRFIEDTNDPGNGDLTFTIGGEVCDTLTNSAVNDMGAGTGTFAYDGEVHAGDILCVYVGKRPDERRSGSEAKEPAAYVAVDSVSGGTVTFRQLREEEQKDLYEIPDNFPFRVNTLPEAGGTVSLADLDTELYAIAMNMAGREDEAADDARTKLSEGDFVTFHLPEIGGDEDLFFGRITMVDGDTITYEPSSREEILRSMDLYDQVETTGDDLLMEEDRVELEEELTETAMQSGFAEEAAYMLADLIVQSDGFEESAAVQEYMLRSAAGPSARAADQLSGSFSLMNAPKLRVQLHTRGERFGGVQVKLTVDARLRVPLGSDVEAYLGDYLAIDVSGSFTEELSFVPTVKGGLTYYYILGIPFPNGVHVNANIDVKNYTAFSFDADVYTTDLNGVVAGEIEHVSSQLEKLMGSATEESYQDALTQLLSRYEEMVGREPGWITLVEKRMFSSECCYFGICYGTNGTFVVRADINLALGSSMEYEVGKRYIFWFEVGLYKPTAGSSTVDLLDERFAFQFYVMGRISVRMGVRLKIYVGLGTGDFASVGITTEIGPYVKLYGFFLYTYSRYRPQNSSLTTSKEQMGGAIGLELGIYFTLGVEATALKIFTASHDFIDEEIPVYHAGDQIVYYGCSYQAEADEAVYIASESSDPADVVMTIPGSYYAVDGMLLRNGWRCSDVLPLDKYFFSVSNSNFTLEQTGDGKLKVHVQVPENVHLLRCALTVTYKGKLPLSSYDITTTVPLIWTDLSERQMKEYFTASLRVGNDQDGYNTVWRQKVLRGEEFDLPTEAEVKKLSHWNDFQYAPGKGYGGQQLNSLGITEDTVYDYNAAVKSYSVTVTGVEDRSGNTFSRTYTAKYGEAFDCSDLENTGQRSLGRFRKFAGLEASLFADMGTDEETGQTLREVIDITYPINQRMAEALSGGSARVRAQYVDDSVTAVYSFAGIGAAIDDVTVTTGRGMEPDMDPVYEAVEKAKEDLGLADSLAIVGITPAHGPIDAATHYTVECLQLSGERSEVRFDENHGDAPVAPIDKLVGSLLTNLPQPERTGYTFKGWADEDGRTVTSVIVPAGGMTLTAQWQANTYTLTLNGNGGCADGSSSNAEMDVVYDSVYGTLPTPTRTGYRFFGWWTEPDGGEQVTEDTITKHTGNRTVYAHWKTLLRLESNTGGGSLFTVNKRTVTYDRNTTYTLSDLADRYSQIAGLYDEEGNPIPTDGFQFELKPKVAAGVSTGKAHDAETYILEITRNADEMYSAYTETHDILVIEKAVWLDTFGTGVFQVSHSCTPIQNKDGSVTASVTLNGGDLDQSTIAGIRFTVSGDGLMSQKSGALGDQVTVNNRVNKNDWWMIKVTVEFPSGIVSKNYVMPTAPITVFSGSAV